MMLFAALASAGLDVGHSGDATEFLGARIEQRTGNEFHETRVSLREYIEHTTAKFTELWKAPVTLSID